MYIIQKNNGETLAVYVNIVFKVISGATDTIVMLLSIIYFQLLVCNRRLQKTFFLYIIYTEQTLLLRNL